MKTPKHLGESFNCILPFFLLCFLTGKVGAQVPAPGEWSPDWLNHWSFNDTENWGTYYGHVPVSVTNLGVSNLGNGLAVVVDNTNGAWLRYNIFEADGTNNLRLNHGSVMFWFAPSWSSVSEGGTGPGDWGRLLEVGSYTTNASYGWWSIYLDPDGANIYFGAQTNNGSEAVYLSAPIAWTTNRWRLIGLTYSSTNSALYLDGEFVTNGLPVTVWPGLNVQSNGFWIGSDSAGLSQARGMFDDLMTYGFEAAGKVIEDVFETHFIHYYMNPMNQANVLSGPGSASATGPVFNAVTGNGNLTAVWTNTAGCITSTDIWITNIVAVKAGATTMNVTFEIAGGDDGIYYDVFANSVLAFGSGTNTAWAWVGQGSHCVSYTLTNLPATACFLILGHPTNSDGDGLTDAYERLVSKTDPLNPDSDGDGLLDGWEVMWATNPLTDDTGQSALRINYVYDAVGWLEQISGVRAGIIGLDNEGNVLEVSP